MTTAWSTLRKFFLEYFRSETNTYQSVFDEQETPSAPFRIKGKDFFWTTGEVRIENRFEMHSDLLGCFSEDECKHLAESVASQFQTEGTFEKASIVFSIRVPASADFSEAQSALRRLRLIDGNLQDVLIGKVKSLQKEALVAISPAHPNGQEGFVVSIDGRELHVWGPVATLDEWIRLLRETKNEWAAPYFRCVWERFPSR